jgi:hypothetical protein
MVPSPGTSAIVTAAHLVAALVTTAATAAPATALQVGIVANRPPKIDISLPDRSSLFAGEKLRFTVTITDPDGDLVDARLVKGLGRMTMRTVSQEHSPAKRLIECWPQPYDVGRQRLVFEANDTVNPARKVRKSVVVDVGNFNYATSGVVIDDVDGDGRFELLATSRGATHDGITGAGVVYRFDKVGAGGVPLRTPSVRYYSTSMTTADFGGDAGQSVLPWDFTGDGRPELTIAATFEDNQLGRLFSFDPTLAHGAPPPLATLSDPAGRTGDELGRSWSARGLFVGDVTGDGVDDLVVACSSRWGSSAGTIVSAAGGVLVFAGGAGWSGAMSPTATLIAPVQHAGDQLSAGASNEDAILLEDVTGDGIKDVVVVASAYTTTSYGEGAIFVWEGGAGLVRKPAPLATLTVANASTGDFLGGFGNAQGVRVADVTGDGIADVIAGSSRADDGAKKDTGALYVWAGGAGLTGNPAPTATLRDSAAYGYEMVGDLGYADSLFLVDLSGDGILDVVTGSYMAAAGGVGGAGQLYVWNGGATLTGALDPTAKLYATGAHAWDHLAYDTPQHYPTIRFADVSGDGRLDVIASAPQSDASGAKDAGAVYVWNGRAGGFAGATPSDAELTLASPRRGDMLGQFGDGPGFDFADLNGDRQLDIVVGAKYRSDGAKSNVGSASLFLGGPGLTGAKTPDAELINSRASPYDSS